MINKSWKPLSRVASGGPAFSISGTAQRLYLASPAGLFAGEGQTFTLIARGFPFLQTSATLVANDLVYAAGLPQGLVRSLDGGFTWAKCWAEQIHSPIVCLAASPRFPQDGVMFAGTQGDGLLRSVDSGKHWALSNFGLRNFSVLALALAPAWGRREVMFAGTEHGVYRSPNGGRAWKLAGLEGNVVQALAVSPHFAEDKTVLAGTEAKGLFRSVDGGATWHKLKTFADAAVNTLCYFEKYLLAGTEGDYIWRSTDGGESWTRSNKTSSTLCIARVGATFYASTEHGLVCSADGKKWTEVGVALQRFDWMCLPADDVWVAAGVSSGVWVSRDGARWQRSATWGNGAPLLNIAASAEVILAATPRRLLRSIDLGATWDNVLDHSLAALAFSDDKTAWAGGEDGGLWLSTDRGRTWQQLATPFDSLPIVGVAAVVPEAVIVGVADRTGRRVLFYRSTDLGGHWKLLLDHSTQWFVPRFGEQAIGLGTQLLQLKGDGWAPLDVTDEDAPVNAVLSLAGLEVVGTAGGVLGVERNKLKDFSPGIEGVPIVALQKRARKIVALSADGQLFERKI